MKFSMVAYYFDRISEHSSRIGITKLIAELFEHASVAEASIISYMALGTIRPAYQASQFNYAEKNISKLLALLFGEEIAFSRAAIQQVGDIGLYVRNLHWPYHDRQLSVEQVYDYLVALEAISGTGAQEEKTIMLLELLKQVDVASASYIIRIIIGTMRLGFSDMTLIDGLSWLLAGNKSLHTALENGYNVCADIGLIATTAKEKGAAGLEHIKPMIGIPIRPAAAERLPSPKAVIDKLGPCVVQPKLDGFRLQIHVRKQDEQTSIWFFSRNLQNMSFMFPDLVSAITSALASTNVVSLIVEGEAIVYDEEMDTFVPFQETVKRKRKHNIEEAAADMPLRLFLFDLLYLNGELTFLLPHWQRREALLSIFPITADHPIIQVIEEKQVTTADELQSYLSQQIIGGLEGVVVKRITAPYQPGKRNFNWIKLKRHVEGHLDDTIDAVVLGYYYGRGKRVAFGIGAFLVGIYNAHADTFETIAKVGTGLKDADWIDLKKQCDTRVAIMQPHNVVCAPELAPDVWVNPELVVVILADEITQSPLHSAGKIEGQQGFALRFPRFMGYATDKAATQATTAHEIREFYHEQFAKQK